VIEVRGIRAVLTDIEGTTSSLAFVKDVLFPFARNALPPFVRSHEPQITHITREIESIVGKSPLTTPEMIDILLQWMDEDRKVTPLKTLQGMVWQTGFESGALQGHIYEDAVRALRHWHAGGLGIHIYSSGSVAAQKLLFSHTPYGDLLPLFSGFFDTTTGPKLEPRSYERIAGSLQLPAESVVFLSDHPGETEAAAAAGLKTILLARAGTSSSADTFAGSFDDIVLLG
jgi:enolase-phosphatase E1